MDITEKIYLALILLFSIASFHYTLATIGNILLNKVYYCDKFFIHRLISSLGLGVSIFLYIIN